MFAMDKEKTEMQMDKSALSVSFLFAGDKKTQPISQSAKMKEGKPVRVSLKVENTFDSMCQYFFLDQNRKWTHSNIFDSLKTFDLIK